MAQFDAQSGRIAGSTGTDDLRGSIVSLVETVRPGQSLPRGSAAEFVLGAPPGSVLALEGIEGKDLRRLLDRIEPQQAIRRALFVRIAPALTADAIVEQVLDLLAATTLRLWPLWFTDVSFHGCRNDTLGRLAMGVTARRAAAEIAGLSQTWAEAAGRLALDGRSPRVSGTLPAIELAQLARRRQPLGPCSRGGCRDRGTHRTQPRCFGSRRGMDRTALRRHRGRAVCAAAIERAAVRSYPLWRAERDGRGRCGACADRPSMRPTRRGRRGLRRGAAREPEPQTIGTVS